MEAPEGVTLTAPIGPTDRGVIWRGQCGDRDRIVRFIDPRFCDERFRDAVRRLRQQHHTQAADIADDGWSGSQYAIVYAVDSPYHTLGELFDEHPRWIDRLRLLTQICEAFAPWQRDPVRTLDFGLHNIALTLGAGAVEPRILPCPAVSLSAPNDLFGLEASVLAAVAPEIVRGVTVNQRAQDRYALGTLAAQAIGCTPSRLAASDAERVEAQARGLLLAATGNRVGIEPFLRGTPQVQRLLDVIGHYRHPFAEARPVGLGELLLAMKAVTDLVGLADTLRPTDPEAAVEVLAWCDDGTPGEVVACRHLAAEICRERGDLGGALGQLDRAVDHAPDHIDVRRARGEVLWNLLRAAPDDPAPSRIPDLIADLEFVAKRETTREPMWWLRLAEAHRRSDNVFGELGALYEALERGPRNLSALYRYGECLKRVRHRDDVASVVDLADGRVASMVAAEMIGEKEGQEWRARFHSLLN